MRVWFKVEKGNRDEQNPEKRRSLTKALLNPVTGSMIIMARNHKTTSVSDVLCVWLKSTFICPQVNKLFYFTKEI